MEKIRRKAVTMEDVAKEAGVSVTTVSHVINQTASITEETSDRVRQAIGKLGYIPRPSADLNRGQRIIGVFVPEISNEFYARSIQAVFQAAWERDYAVMVCSMEHRHQAESSYIRSLLQSGVKGLIFFGGSMENDQQIIRAAKRVPVVLGDRRMSNVPIDSVGTDNQDAMRRLVGADSFPLLAASALGGACFVTICDLLARVLFAPFELPVGVVLAFAGVPFFLWLLFRQRGGRT